MICAAIAPAAVLTTRASGGTALGYEPGFVRNFAARENRLVRRWDRAVDRASYAAEVVEDGSAANAVNCLRRHCTLRGVRS